MRMERASHQMLALWLRMLLTTTSWDHVQAFNKAATSFNLEEICQSPNTEMFIQDAVTVSMKTIRHNEEISLDDFDNSTHVVRPNVSSMPAVRCQITFNLAPEQGAFLLVSLQNNLPINRDRCMAWNPIMRLRSHKQNLGLGCVRSTTRFFDAPLSLVLNTLILKSLLQKYEWGFFSLTVTAIVFDCNAPSKIHDLDDHATAIWWPCSFDERYCVQRQLFCDSINNCGSNEDEDRRLCTFGAADESKDARRSNERRENARDSLLEQILRKYQRTQDTFGFSFLARENLESEATVQSWKRTYLPVVSVFFAFLVLMGVSCFVYVWWTKQRNQRLQRNFIDYVIKYRGRNTALQNRLPISSFDSFPLGLAETLKLATASDEAALGFEWSAEHRSLLGRRR